MRTRKSNSAKKTANTTAEPPHRGSEETSEYEVETVDVAQLRPHPRNYKRHPEAQLEHIAESLRSHGFYKNIVVARDGTILAGHGIVEAARKIGYERVPVRRLAIGPDDPIALKIIVADNELGRFAESDDRALTEMLRSIAADAPDGLFGTGYDEQMLAALVMVTRPESEIRDFDAAAEWTGMPEFDAGVGEQFILTVQCLTAKDREQAAAKLGVKTPKKMKQGKIWTGWYPEGEAERKDLSSLEWQVDDKAKDAGERPKRAAGDKVKSEGRGARASDKAAK